MHKYMRAIGFSKVKNSKDMHDIIMESLSNADKRSYVSHTENTILAEFDRDFASHIGVAVCGEFDEDDKFTFEYCYPYLRGENVSTMEDVTVESHADKESYAGVVEEPKVGVSLVFYLQNMIHYVKVRSNDLLPIKGTTLNLSALCLKGMVIMPLMKDEAAVAKSRRDTQKRAKLVADARSGDENAIETLTLSDMDTYNLISNRIRKEDVLTLVDTYFMPYGVECDQYSILGEITECHTETNSMTGEEIWVMTVVCNELTFDVCINKIDLYGEPAPGRRFKGAIWMQGFINFPENAVL